GWVGVMLGNGDGTFRSVVNYDLGEIYPSSLAIGDVNGDGNPDVLVASCLHPSCSPWEGAASVLLGNGDGTFKPPVHYSTGYGFGLLLIADVNGDSQPDIVVSTCTSASCSEGAVGVLLGNGDGTFEPVVTYDAGGSLSALAVADVDGDGNPDLVIGVAPT